MDIPGSLPRPLLLHELPPRLHVPRPPGGPPRSCPAPDRRRGGRQHLGRGDQRGGAGRGAAQGLGRHLVAGGRAADAGEDRPLQAPHRRAARLGAAPGGSVLGLQPVLLGRGGLADGLLGRRRPGRRTGLLLLLLHAPLRGPRQEPREEGAPLRGLRERPVPRLRRARDGGLPGRELVRARLQRVQGQGGRAVAGARRRRRRGLGAAPLGMRGGGGSAGDPPPPAAPASRTCIASRCPC
mmetsp:Transcript_125737/g.391548  ORF Transcript_125737/g.391548 Transcript_125737/m.391548 type:complete len:239 (+) Transcript_125737:74-790(+)